jgi:hypothetical protein
VNCPSDEFYAVDSVQHCIVIRAAVFNEAEECISSVVTHSYFIKALGCDTHGLPAVSLCADSLDLFSFSRGIFLEFPQAAAYNPYQCYIEYKIHPHPSTGKQRLDQSKKAFRQDRKQ